MPEREIAEDGSPVVGVLADPETAPVDVARQLAAELPTVLSALEGADRAWSAEVVEQRLPAPGGDHGGFSGAVGEQMADRGWSCAIAVTDLPLRQGVRPVAADMHRRHGVVVVSLPAFGAMPRRRVHEVVRYLVGELVGQPAEGVDGRSRDRRQGLSGGLRRIEPQAPGVDLRVVASRGRLRLLVGMVRDNRPWRLLAGLTGALAAAFAFSAFWMINPTIWQLSDALGPLRLSIAMIGTITAMVVWLIVAHHLWEQATSDAPYERDEVVLFNASTVATLAVGVGCMYVGLLAVNFVAVHLVVATEVLAQTLGHQPTIADYAAVTWMATSGATVAGALGTGFESEDAVREAAYSYRERERRQQRADRRRGSTYDDREG